MKQSLESQLGWLKGQVNLVKEEKAFKKQVIEQAKQHCILNVKANASAVEVVDE